MSQGHRIIGRIDTTSIADNALHNHVAAKTGQPLKPDGWTLTLVLHPWSEAKGEALGGRLLGEITCSDRQEGERLSSAFQPGSFISATAATAPAPDQQSQRIELTAIEGEADDPLLAAFAPDTPQTFTHTDLGTFRQDARLPDLFEGSATFAGRAIGLVLSNEVGSLDEAARHAAALMSKATLWDAEWRERIHQHYYQIWEESWRENEDALSKSDWMARLVLESLEVDADGQFVAWFADEDLFWGHSMEVTGSIDEGVKRVTMMG
ncbi:MAG: DUF2262 domain-containing protein [Pseudomonadota bacterium]